MAYGTPMQNQNKGYAAQEKKDLLGDMPIDKRASGGSWISKHVSSPLAMGKAHGMAPKMEGDTPLAKHTKAQGEKLNPGLVSAIHMHDDFTKKNNIKHK